MDATSLSIAIRVAGLPEPPLQKFYWPLVQAPCMIVLAQPLFIEKF